MPTQNLGSEHDKDAVDLARLSDRELSSFQGCNSLIMALLERRISDCCDVARGKLHPQQAGGTLEQLSADAAAWIAEVAPDTPVDAAERIRLAVLEVVAEERVG